MRTILTWLEREREGERELGILRYTSRTHDGSAMPGLSLYRSIYPSLLTARRSLAGVKDGSSWTLRRWWGERSSSQLWRRGCRALSSASFHVVLPTLVRVRVRVTITLGAASGDHDNV